MRNRQEVAPLPLAQEAPKYSYFIRRRISTPNLLTMGDPSSLRLVPASSASIPIDWDRVPEASKKFLLRWSPEKGLPATIGDLANTLDESKFFGYFGSSLCTLLMDISEFGLQAAAGPGKQCGPRFYMKYLEQVWFILFMPGKRDCISGYSRNIIRKGDYEYDQGEEDAKNDEEDNDKDDGDGDDEMDDDEYERYMEEQEKKMAAEEAEIAQKFDLKLTQEVSKGAADIVDITKKLAGWESTMIHQDNELAQYFEAVMTLPITHSAHKGMMATVMSSIHRGGSGSDA